MTRMTGPDCVVMCNLINTYIHTYILIRTVQSRIARGSFVNDRLLVKRFGLNYHKREEK